MPDRIAPQPRLDRRAVGAIEEREANETVIANWFQTRKPPKRTTNNINDLEGGRLTEEGLKAVKGNVTDRYLDSQLQGHERKYSQAGVFTDEDANTIEVLHGTVPPGQTQAEDLGAEKLQYERRQARAVDADVTEFLRGSPQLFGNAATKPSAVPHHSIMTTSSHLKSASPREKRVVGFVKDGPTGVSRPASIAESWALYDVEMHTRNCATCHNPYDVYLSGRRLCDEGHRLAQQVAHFLYMKRDGEAYSTEEEAHQIVRVEIPPSYEEARGLLRAIERGARHHHPFVSMDRRVPDRRATPLGEVKELLEQGKPVIKVEQTPPPPGPKKTVEHGLPQSPR
ncbi:hypothetical protein SLS56_001692 [Neofusicoccum ribis]|uniref:Uncharacterized protein n=1 Tax=Neofusicoccum ribis TaxID=45134 RepID=A0ABR3T7U0_9PEZI